MKDHRIKELEEAIEDKAVPHYLEPLLRKFLRIITDQDRKIRRLERRC